MQAGLNVLQGQPVNDWRNYDARIEAVTRKFFDTTDVNELSRLVRHPERVSRLILVGAFVVGRLARATTPDARPS